MFTNNGTILSLPERRPLSDLPQTLALDAVAGAIRSTSLHSRPRLPTAVGHCFLVKRAALDLVGPFDEAFSPGYGEEVDFSQRCVRSGLVHVLADDVFVLHKGSASFSSSQGSAIKQAHDRAIGVRYPYYDRWVWDVATSNAGPFAHAIQAANRALRDLTVTIDARTSGLWSLVLRSTFLELLGALARTDGVWVRAVVPPALGDYAQDVLARHKEIHVVPVDAVRDGSGRTDVVHRPLQWLRMKIWRCWKRWGADRDYSSGLDRLSQPRLFRDVCGVGGVPRACAVCARLRRPRGVLFAQCAQRGADGGCGSSDEG